MTSPMTLTWCPLTHRGVVKITGPDRKTFLQGLLTQDIFKLTPEHPVYAAFLTPQGKFLHDLFISEQGDALFLEGERDRLPDLLKRLSLFKLRSAVTLTPLPKWQVYVAMTQGSEVDQSGPLLTLADPRTGLTWQRGYWAENHAPQNLSPFTVYNDARLSLGLPEGSWDMIPEKAIPLECGLDDLGAIDWQKGCYLGQELTARTKHRGLVRKRLLPFQAAGPLSDPAGKSILKGDQEVGKVFSFQGHRGLARLRLEALPASETAALTLDGDPIQVSIPPWVRLPEKGKDG